VIAQRSAREGIKVHTITDVPVPANSMEELVEMYERNLSPQTKLLVVTHPWNTNGQLMPVREICDMAHSRGVEVLVDGAQSFALVDHRIGDLGCDYYAASLHKWFCGPIGTGILYIRHGKADKVWSLFPPSANGSPRNPMGKFVGLGTRSAALGAGIAEAITFHESIGAERKEARLRQLTEYWSERIRALPSARFYTPEDREMSCGIAAFNLEGIDASQLVEHLWQEHQILVSALTLDQSAAGRPAALHVLRVTPHVYTTLAELDRFVEIIETIAARGRIE
jgi:isopenicillin-N epimerase